MQKIEWNQDLQVGIKRLDDDHQQIVETINRLYEPMSASDYFYTLSEVLCDLIVHSNSHLGCEEKQLCSAGYPQCDEIRSSYFNYLEKISEYALTLKDCDDQQLRQIPSYLSRWWLEHIEEDRVSRDYFSPAIAC